MHDEHPSFPQPSDQKGKIWRYMGFMKFVDMMRTGGLFFSRADKLGDPFEGSWPRRNAQAWREHTELMRAKAIASNIEFSQDGDSLSRAFKGFTQNHAVNCWHMNDSESDAMWRLYQASNDGIAVQTRYDLLCESFRDTTEHVYVGRVQYLDYETQVFSLDNTFNPYMHKRISFQHEHEIRAIVTRYPESGSAIENGLLIPVSLSDLVQAIYVAPFCPNWVMDNVEEVIGRFGYSFKVLRSNLERSPEF